MADEYLSGSGKDVACFLLPDMALHLIYEMEYFRERLVYEASKDCDTPGVMEKANGRQTDRKGAKTVLIL